MFVIGLSLIYIYIEKNKPHHLGVARKIITLIGFVYVLIGIMMFPIYLYKLGFIHVFFKVYKRLSIGGGFVLACSFLIPLILKCIYKTTYYRLILTIRYIWQLFKVVAIIYAIFAILIIGGSGFFLSFYQKDSLSIYSLFFTSYAISSYLICGLFIAFGAYNYIKRLRKQKMFYIRKARTILYLRSFEIDNSLLNERCMIDIQEFTESCNYNLIKVGNPNSIFEMNSYYLPTTNWKYHVNNLIRSHKMVFVVLGKTQGLAWEVIRHQEYWAKYVFYVPDKTTLDYWIKLTSDDGNIKLSNILSKIELENEGVAFCIENNISYYSESICDVVFAHEWGIYESNITYIKNNLGEQSVKLSSNHTVYLYSQQRELLATINEINPYYLNLDEYNKIKFYRQKFSRKYKKAPSLLLREIQNGPIIPVDIPTESLSKIYFYEYTYIRLILEPALLIVCFSCMKVCPPTSFLILAPLSLAMLVMIISNVVCVVIVIPIEKLIFLKNKLKKN
jgi:hypothetical protein